MQAIQDFREIADLETVSLNRQRIGPEVIAPKAIKPDHPMNSNQIGSGPIAERLQRATEELKALEQLIVTGDFAPRLLSDFRNAVDSIRQTARVVQKWVGLQEQQRDPYAAISSLSEDRVRRATQIAKDLTIDLQSLEVDFGTEGLAELFQAIEVLHERLVPLFRTGDHRF